MYKSEGYFFACVKGQWYMLVGQRPESEKDVLLGEPVPLRKVQRFTERTHPKEDKVYHYFNSSM